MPSVILETPWFTLYSYGFLVALGYSIGSIWIILEARKKGADSEAIFDMLIVQLFVGILGSRLLFVIEYAPEKLNFKDFFSFHQGGLTFYGAVISSFLFDVAWLKFKKINVLQGMDFVGFGWPLGMAVARIGCFLNNCCYGIETSAPWGVEFASISSGMRHPTQVYESLSVFVIFLLLQFYKKRQKNYGEIFILSMSFYAIARFFIEFFRAENPVVALGMQMSQLIAVVAVALSIVSWFFINKSGSYVIKNDCNKTEQ